MAAFIPIGALIVTMGMFEGWRSAHQRWRVRLISASSAMASLNLGGSTGTKNASQQEPEIGTKPSLSFGSFIDRESIEGTMKRNEHLFQFSGKQISEAAKLEHGYHIGRVQWWEAEQSKAIEKAKSAGVEVREYDVTGGKRADVVLDPSVAGRLTECANKLSAHRLAADRFQIEAAAYGTQPDRSYDLHPDDVIYFRLVGGSLSIDDE